MLNSRAYSIEESSPERRRDQRHQTVLRVGVLEAKGRAHLCTVRNVSATGVKAKVFTRLSTDEKVRIRLREDEWHCGTVIWCKADLVGIEFIRPLDGKTLSEALGFDEVRRPRVPRIGVHSSAILRIGARNHRVLVKDISPRGAGLQLNHPPGSGEACLTLPGLNSIRGQIRWIDGTAVGMSFNEILPLMTLASWIAEFGDKPEEL